MTSIPEHVAEEMIRRLLEEPDDWAAIAEEREAGVAAHRARMARWSDFDSRANRLMCNLLHRGVEPPQAITLDGGGSWLFHNVNRQVTRASGRKKK